MTAEVVSVLCGGTGFNGYLGETPFRQLDNRCNQYSPRDLYQRALETSKSDVIIYAHDDVDIHDKDWIEKILIPFNEAENPFTACVGLGGALSLGRPDLYRKPFDIWNMARGGYMSNQDDWQVHGAHEEGIRQVAVVDAFVVAVNTHWLRAAGGWPTYLTHHCLDLWVACEAARSQRDSYMVGVSCLHKGGGSSTKPAYKDAKWLAGNSLESDHVIPHKLLYEEYRDVLPIIVEAE